MANGMDLGTVYAGVGLRYDDFDRGKQHVEREVIDLERQMEQATQRMGEQWERLGRSMSVAVTVPLALIGRQMVNAFAEFEQRMAMTGAVSRATEQQWQRMAEVARELGATTQFTASQAAEGMTFLAMAGFEVNDIIGAMPGVLQLAASAQLDLASAADITTNILTGYGLAVEELARVNDVLVSAMTGANTNLQQLGEAMKYAGPVASAAGLEFEEAAAAIALMGNAGIQGSMAGTSLRGAITRLLNPTGQVRDLIRDLGLNIYDTNGNLLGMTEIISELERVQVSAGDMMVLFGQRAGPAMQALVDQGSDALERFYQRLRESSGLAEQVATAQMDTLRGSILELQSAWEGATLKAMDQVEPSLRALIDTGTGLLNLWNSLPDSFHRGAVAMGAVLAVAGPLTIAVRTLATALAPMAGPLGIVLAVASGVGLLAAAFGGAKQSVEELNTAQLDQARAMREQSNELRSLLDEYEALSGKPGLSAEEHSRLETVMQRIIDIQPTIAAGYDDIGEAIRRNLDPLREYADALRLQSETLIEMTAARAVVMIPGLERERADLMEELERRRQERDAYFDEYVQVLKFRAEIQRLHREAEMEIAKGADPSAAFAARDELLRQIYPDRPWALPGELFISFTDEVAEAERKLEPVTARMLEIAERIDAIDASLTRLGMAEEVWYRMRQGLDPFAEDLPEWSLTPFTQSLERVTAETERTLAESIRNENALWQAKIRLVQSGTKQYVDEFGTLQDVVQDYLTWLSTAFSDPAPDEELADWFQSEREDAEAKFQQFLADLERWREEQTAAARDAGKSEEWITDNITAQYEQILKVERQYHQDRLAQIDQQEQEAANELLAQRAWLADQIQQAQKQLNDVLSQGPRAVDILRDGTADDVWAEVDRLFARYGPMAERLREFMGVEIGDLEDLHALRDRIDNLYRYMVETGRVTAAEQADVLAHQITMVERGSSEWVRLTTEWHRLITQVSEEEIRARWDAMEAQAALYEEEGNILQARLLREDIQHQQRLAQLRENDEAYELELQRHTAAVSNIQQEAMQEVLEILREASDRINESHDADLHRQLDRITQQAEADVRRMRALGATEDQITQILQNAQTERAQVEAAWYENRRQALEELNISILRAQGEFYKAELAQLELARDRDLQRVGDDNEQRLLILQRYEAERAALIQRQTDTEIALLEESTQRLFDLEANALDQRLARIDREQEERERRARETILDEERLAQTLANIQREYDALREQARLEAHLREQAAVSAHQATLLRIQGAGWEAERAAARAALDAALASAPGDPEAARRAQEIYDAEIASIERRIKEAYEQAGEAMREASMSAMERDLADIDRRAEEFIKAGRSEIEVTEWVTQRKTEIREKYRYEELAAEQRFQAELATLEGREFDAALARIEATRYSSLAQGVDPTQVEAIANAARIAAMVAEVERVLQESLSDIELQVRLGELDEAEQIEAYERALDAANSMFDGIQVSARTAAQVEAQIAEMRRRLYDDTFQRAKENIERQAEREGWRLDQLADRLETEAKLYQLTEEQKRALEHETWRLRDRQRQEDERRAEERRKAQERYEAELQQYLVESGQITVQEGLRRDLEAARERARIAEQLAQELGGIDEEANQQLAEAQLALSRAEFALKRQELDDDRAFYETKVALGQWETEERLDQLRRIIQRERELLGEQAEHSLTLRQLLIEERQLKRQIAAEDAERRIQDIRAGERTIRGLIIQRQELEALYARYVAGGDESVEALERVREALREVGNELDKVLGEQLLVRMASRLENVLAGRMDVQDWFMAGIQDVVDDAARSITSQLTPAVAKFVELSVSGAYDFERAWTKAFSEVEITGTDVITILVMELVKLISGYMDAAKKLDEAVARDREQTQADRERFEALMSAGFAGEFETSTRKHTEQVKYLFGLFRSNVTRTVEVTSEETQRLIENLERMLQELQRTGQTAMREAFDAPVGLAGIEFLSNLRRGIYDHVRDGLIQAFMEHQMYTRAMAPLWQAIDEGISAAFSGSSFDPDQFWQVVGPALDQWTRDIGDLEGPVNWVQDILAQLAELLDLPMQVGEQISRGGTRLTNLTGEQRDLFVEMWRPISLEATQAPTRHHDHMSRLDTIIDILVRSLGGGDELQTFLRAEQATMHATTITIEHIVTATLTGPIQGPVNMFVDGEDLERVVNRILKEHERAGMQGVRSMGG